MKPVLIQHLIKKMRKVKPAPVKDEVEQNYTIPTILLLLLVLIILVAALN